MKVKRIRSGWQNLSNGIVGYLNMATQIDPKLRSLIEILKPKGFVLKGISNGFRIKLEKGPDVDIYTLKSNPSHVRARIKTAISDDDERSQMVESIHALLAESLQSIVDLQDFRLTKDMEEGFVYYAHMDFSVDSACDEKIGGGHHAGKGAEAFEAKHVVVEDQAGDSSPDPAAEAGGDPEGAEDQIDFVDFMENGLDLTRPEAVVDRLEAVDAKMLRQAMDSLCLPRSSNVRMVLTRLYRSAVDAEELKAAMAVEAAKVSTQEDVAELKMIKEMHSVDFLSPLIDLLWCEVKDQQ